VAYLTRYFDTIEINSSFYGLPQMAAAQAWAEHAGGNPRFHFTTCEIAIETGYASAHCAEMASGT